MADKVKTVPALSDGARRVLAALKVEGKPMTAAEVKAVMPADFKVNSAHFVALRTRGLVTSTEVTVECPDCGAKRKVLAYTLTDAGVAYKD